MSDNDFTFSFSSGRMVMLISLLLLALCLCFLLGTVSGMREKEIEKATAAVIAQGPEDNGSPESPPVAAPPRIEKLAISLQAKPPLGDPAEEPTQLAAVATSEPEEVEQTQAESQTEPQAEPEAPSPKPAAPAFVPAISLVPQLDPESEPTIPLAGGGEICVQVSSSRDKAATEAAVENLKRKGFPTFLETRDLGERGIYYRVMVGKFSTKAEAEQALAALRKKTKYTSGLIKVARKESPLDEIREDIGEKGGQVNAVPAHVPFPKRIAPPKALMPIGRPYVIQVASVQKGFPAQAMVKHLKSKGFTAYIKTIDIPGRGVWYRILVGDFETKEAAAEVLARLQQDREFKDSFIKLKK